MTLPLPLVVGIDLGTTHTVVAWRDPDSTEPTRIFQIPQSVSAGEVEARPLLPSCLYAPLTSEAAADPFGDAPWMIGEYARRRGQEVPGRLVASSKSWLCHPGVDRFAPILPWASHEEEEGPPRISPVEAAARILWHVRRTWDWAFPKHPLSEQTLILTVPASFDEVARELTVRAAAGAGLTARLLEEPQAAFYDYLEKHGDQELASLVQANSDPALVLVCDVGGGTTDIALLRVASVAGAPLEVTRLAVGRHLLLGGDNLDLALAHACEARLVPQGERLESGQFAELVLACRVAKERLLDHAAPDAAPIRLLGSGASLVGATRATTLSRSEVEELLLEGFLPLAERGTRVLKRRAGLVAFGLPYEVDPAISRHLVEFLERHLPDGSSPRALLLNGGLFRAERARDRLCEAVAHWSGTTPLLLTHDDPDLAVARGAVAYGLALLGRGLKIQGGTAHGYYVAVESGAGQPRRAVCVVPRGATEGVRHVAASELLALRLGQPVRFELYASEGSEAHAPGDLVEFEEEHLVRLAPLVMNFEASGSSLMPELGVVLEGELSALGTVELACVEASSLGSERRRFRLAFDLRKLAAGEGAGGPAPSTRQNPLGERLEQALEALDRVFGKGRKDVKTREGKDLIRELERLLGARAEWSTELNRRLFDSLAPKHGARRRSPEHERVFWMLSGYCLRPGFGHPKDPERVGLLVPLFEQGLAFSDQVRGSQQFWIAWRRIAGGLNETAQVAIRDLLDPYLAPEALKLKRPKGFRLQAPDELIELASWLERVSRERRMSLGEWLFERTWTRRDPRIWTAIGRIGARVPAYGSVHYVVPPRSVERWLDALLREKWTDLSSAPWAAMQLARVTLDRARDISESVRKEVMQKLQQCDAPEAWVQAVQEYVPVEEAERAAWFEDLPVGLRLVESTEAGFRAS